MNLVFFKHVQSRNIAGVIPNIISLDARREASFPTDMISSYSQDSIIFLAIRYDIIHMRVAKKHSKIVPE